MKTEPSIGIIMGSQSDWPTLKYSANILDEFDIVYETKIISAHRTPDRLWAVSYTHQTLPTILLV